MGIRVQDLKVVFRGPDGAPVPVLDVPKLEVPDATELCLSGGSGSGKTTLLNVLAGIVVPESGQVWHDGVEITSLSERRRDAFRAASVGYVFQTFNLLQGLTALENVRLPQGFAGHRGHEAAVRARALLERVGLGHRLHARPATLSVGEQQRVALARAVVNRPRVVLADEPTANLDERHGDEVLALLRETVAAEGAILILVTHERRIQERFATVVPLKEISR